ncbi:hypothetical protein AAB992_13920 [Burkholderia contaminans]|uniref:DUF4376 domain-containing protein n=1 Tax=Burkholderia contaminans TaxID=488447 RepID=UPI0024161A3B|nr:hypothetical protein [Burkholderia contaminans]WFN14430.1 hypothetical protein LXE92_36595 [Burkholderia contaminans]
MKYGCSATFNGVEALSVVLDLSAVPHFNPASPPANAYGVPDDAQPGWVVTHAAGGSVSFAAPAPAPRTPIQQYVAAINSGIVVTCSATPALNATYGVSDIDAANISAEAQFIAIYAEFTNGATTFPWADVNRQPHTFPNTATFMAFAKAAAQYVSACKQTLIALQNGDAASFPSNAVTL